MIRVVLPYHLRTLANVGAEVTLDVAAPVTQRTVLMLRPATNACGTIRTTSRLPLPPALLRL